MLNKDPIDAFIADLRAKADKATPGPYQALDGPDDGIWADMVEPNQTQRDANIGVVDDGPKWSMVMAHVHPNDPFGTRVSDEKWRESWAIALDQAAFFASLDPTTVRLLLDVVAGANIGHEDEGCDGRGCHLCAALAALKEHAERGG